MLKRIVAVSVVLIMCTPFTYAWNSESFIGMDQVQTMQDEVNDTIYSVSDDVQLMYSSRPMMMAAANDVAVAADEGETVTKVSGTDFFSCISPYGAIDGYTLVANGYQPSYEVYPGGPVVPSYPVTQWDPRPMGSFVFGSDFSSPSWTSVFVSGSFSFPRAYGDRGGYLSSVSDIRFGVSGTPLGSGTPEYYVRYVDLSFDLSGFPEFKSFSLSGSDLCIYFDPFVSGESLGWSLNGGSLELIVNGSSARVFSTNSDTGRFSFNDYVYNSLDPVTSVVFRLSCPNFSLSIPDSGISGDFYFVLLSQDSSNVSFTILEENDVLNGANDQGQTAVNNLNSIEADWTGQMNSNFNSLNLSSFEYPDGLVPAFALITGIFNDLWNIMGSFNFVYVFPLYLGIVLVVIGKLSKSSGGQSSSKDDRGNSDA